MNSPLLEIIGFDLEGCRIAESNGASRIELCAEPSLGGITPSRSLVKEVCEQMSIPVMVMIRPRGGDFCYNEAEVLEMLETIAYCKTAGCTGVVFGALTTKGDLDFPVVERLVEASKDMDITFHRAFDQVNDPIKALHSIGKLGIKRILTSGQQPTALEGKDLLTVLAEDDVVTILPGSGIVAANIGLLHSTIKTSQYHSSAKRVDDSGLYLGVDAEEVREMRRILDASV